MDRYPVTDDTQPVLELWEPDPIDRTQPFDGPTPAGRHLGGRIARAFPGVVAGTFLVAAIAFGAALRPSDGEPAGDGGGAAMADGADATEGDGPAATDVEPKPGADEPTDKPDGTEPGADEPTDKPDGTEPDAPADKPDGTEPDAPADIATLELALHLRDGYVKIDWSACDRDGFRYYKIVRSTNEQVSWPLGDGDALVAAIEDVETTAAADTGFAVGKTYFYRVFGLVDGAAGPTVACASPVRGVTIPAPTPKPTDKPEPTDKPDATDPPSGSLALTLSIKEGKPYLDWSECSGDFHFYKIVRSTDSTVTWPKGAGDSVAGAVGPDGKTALLDGDAPAGKKVWYRVFCIRETESGHRIVAASAAKSIVVPANEPAPEPDPVVLDIEAGQDGDGVRLAWEASGGEVFVYYKVVRSGGSNPSYLPGTDGSQVIAVIENPGVTSFMDTDVAAGQTWYYRIQAIGYMNGHKILLGQTAAVAVTVE